MISLAEVLDPNGPHPKTHPPGGATPRFDGPPVSWLDGAGTPVRGGPGMSLGKGFRWGAGRDTVDERLEMARRHGVQGIDVREQEDIAEALRGLTDGLRRQFVRVAWGGRGSGHAQLRPKEAS